MGRNCLFILKPQNHFIEVLGRSYSTKNGRGGDAFDLCRSVVQAFLRERVGDTTNCGKQQPTSSLFVKLRNKGIPKKLDKSKP